MSNKTKRLVLFVNEETAQQLDKLLEEKRAHDCLLTTSSLLRTILQEALSNAKGGAANASA